MKFVQCNCLTKTPEPRYHKRNCPVWLVDRVEKLQQTIESALKLSPLWIPQHEKVSCEYGDELTALSNMYKRLSESLTLQDDDGIKPCVSDHPLLDELESGPWPQFVKDLKKSDSEDQEEYWADKDPGSCGESI